MNNNTYTTKETSFWKFIQENEIEIPIIQRDYAQGRVGKESLRKSFLGDLKKALDNEKPYKDKAMKMDFVYGSVEHDKMNPLDGQQRLTTLWLLHWYIALRAGKLNVTTAEILNRFSYETRISSREFCGNLCNIENFKEFDGTNIVGFITRQTWFYSAWKQDPTIQAMLRMLGGTKEKDKKGENIIDGIEELFPCPQDCEIHEGERCVIYRQFNEYWDKLTDDNCPIIFYHLPLKDFGLSDDLYIKMNARGKQLTSFENFKADLVDYITEQSESTLLPDIQRTQWKSLLDEITGIPIKMDTAWTDIFWKNKSDDNKIDEIYFAFLNRFFWDKLFMYKNEGKYVLDIGKDDETSTQENKNTSYKYLNNSDAGQNVYDTTISYKELDVYKFFDGDIPYNVFEDLQIVLNRYSEIPICTWDESFRFIPTYENDNNGKGIEITDTSGEKILKVTYLNQVQRVVFHAVCKYFKEGDADSDSLKRWMRVVCNLVSGEDADGRAQIRSTRAVRTAMEFIDTLNSHSVYESLKEKVLYTNNPSDFESRCNEEIVKARQILDENGELRKYNGIHKKEDGSAYNTWEEIIIDAEKSLFFKGAIRFLFRDDKGNMNNWCNFDIKLDKTKKYFDENGLKEDFKIEVTKALVIQCNSWEDQLKEKQIFNPNAQTWKFILCSSYWIRQIHHILTKDKLDQINITDSLSDTDADKYIKPILTSLPYEEFINKEPNGRFKWYGPRLGYYKPYGRDAIIFDWKDFHRNELLNQLVKEIIIDNSPIENRYWWGWDIRFKFKSFYFMYYYNNTICLMNDDWNGKKLKSPNDEDTEDNNFYFPVTDNESKESFLSKLQCLITQA